jgi:hypothetical protein
LLQQFQALHTALARVTSDASVVAGEDSRLVAAEHRGYARVARSEARRLQRDAAELKAQSGATGNRVRALARQAPPGVVKRYLVAVRDSLTADWYEGSAVMHVARAIAADPYGLVPTTVERLHSYQSRARRDARRAGSFAAQAALLRRRHPADFRYVPKTPTRGEG